MADNRPLKRQRKLAQHNDESPFDTQLQPAHIDHIFIADGVANKKPGAKKTPLSCCECRRLKLKCDRNFPCASCRKRGCAEICPDGVLVSGKGTRFILANTEQLHSKIHEMSDRIRALEDALVVVHADRSTEPHPLMAPQFLGIKSTMGLYSGAQSTHSAEQGGKSDTGLVLPPPPITKTARPRHDHMDVDDRGSSEDTFTPADHIIPSPGSSTSINSSSTAVAHPSSSHANHSPIIRLKQEVHDPPPHFDDYEAEILRLSRLFPLSEKISPEQNIPLREYIRNQLPPREEADYLWEQAIQNALWQYNPHPSPTFFPLLSHHCYTNDPSSICPRRLALLLMVLAIGCLVDPARPPDAPDAEKYHRLARASLCEIPVMEETTTETITALFYEIWYLLVFSDKKKAAGYAWGLMGLTAKLAQAIGLHRNGKSKMIPEEVEKRRSLFWELLYLDARLSLSLGRPPSLSIYQMDCQRPSYTPDENCDPSESLHYYQEWKHLCYEKCLAPVLDAVSQPHLDYDKVLDLDRQIRDFSMPLPLRAKTLHTKSLIMQKASLSNALEAVLLQLHRSFFTRALSGPEEAFNKRHKYAPSVVAVFLSASRMIATLEELYNFEKELASRILGYWSNAFSAAIALCLLVSRAPFTCLSPAALQELERARLLFNSAKDVCPRALQVMPILEGMIIKANDIYNRWSNGHELPTIVLRHTTDEFSLDSDYYGYENVSYGSGGSSYPSQVQQQQHAQVQQQQQTDSFARTHRSLSQCILEVHQRAKSLFPMRKPCQCSVATAKLCPPSHSWSPPPKNVSPHTSPVLPEVPSVLANSSALVFRAGDASPMRDMSPMHRMSPMSGPAAAVYGLSSASLSISVGGSRSASVSTQGYNGAGDMGSGPGLYYAGDVLPADGPAIPSPPPVQLLSPSSKLAVVDSLNFELGALNSNTEQSWMAFF